VVLVAVPKNAFVLFVLLAAHVFHVAVSVIVGVAEALPAVTVAVWVATVAADVDATVAPAVDVHE